MTKRFVLIICLMVGGLANASLPKNQKVGDFNTNLKNPTQCPMLAEIQRAEASNPDVAKEDLFPVGPKEGKFIQQAKASGTGKSQK